MSIAVAVDMEPRKATAVPTPQTLDHETLRELAAHRDSACISLFSPLYGAEPMKAHRTRLFNLIDDVADTVGRHTDDGVASRMIGALRSFVAADEIERDAGAGLAVFADTTKIRWCYLPWEVAPKSDVGDRFTIKPLAPAEAADRFFVVALSKDRARIFRADRASIEELQPEDLPRRGIDDVPGADAESNRLQMYSGRQNRGPRGGMNEAIFHGHRDDTRGEDELVARLCRRTSEALRKVVPDRGIPVIVAAVERLAASFRREARWMTPLAVIEGNPDDATAEEIHRRALPELERYLEGMMAEHARHLGDAIHHGRGSSDLASIVLAASDGRIDTLFVDRSLERWGRVEPAEREVVVHEEPRPSDDDLVDRAISDTLARGGHVVPFVPVTLDDAEPIAALYRHA